jgi:TonB dependent receptor-like, beta-barrel/TonB-dependent Receptor Plug Domain
MNTARTALMAALFAFGAAETTDAQAPAGPVDDSGAASSDANVASYPASFYAEFRPNTALDMIQRTPAFSFDGGRQDVRGLSGAAGNVLIDGQTQTSKSVTLRDALARIPASQVARIEIVRGGAGAVDMSGFPVVANVVRTPGPHALFILEADGAALKPSEQEKAGLRTEWSRSSGKMQFSGTVEARQESPGDASIGLISRAGYAGAVLDGVRFTARGRNRSLNANGEASYQDGDAIYRADFGVEFRRTRRDELAAFTAPEEFLLDSDQEKFEVGGNIERAIGAGLLAKIDALQTYKTNKDDVDALATAVHLDTAQGESILRAGLTWRGSGDLSVEAGAEAAFNFRDQTSTLTSANANVRVEERRAEPYATINWQALAPLSLELGVRYETSTISETGDTQLERSFSFVKPRFNGSLDLGGGLQIRQRVERSVSQLDFGDFSATAGSTAGGAAAGNAKLQPQRSWEFETAIEKRLGERSAVVLTYKREAIEEVLDYAAVSATSDGRSNIGPGTKETYSLDLKMALDGLGIRGGRIEVLPSYVQSKAVDPFGGQQRQISGFQFWRGRMSYYLDRPELNSTFGIGQLIGFRERQWRIDRVETTVQGVFYNVWWDWTPRPNLAVHTEIENLGGHLQRRLRDYYMIPRSLGVPTVQEMRKTNHPAALNIKLRRTF